MIAQVVGPPGAGKSFYAVKKAVEALEAHKVVVTNFDLQPDWVERVADHRLGRYLIPGRRDRLKALWAENVYVVKDMSEMSRIRVPGSREGRAVAVLDEAHRWLNSRMWDADDRMEGIDWFTLHRKLGFDVYLITQDAKNLDRQIRNLFEYEIRLKNLKKMRVAGVPISPVNFFLAVWSWHGVKGGAAVKREWYRLTWHRRLYDTMAAPGGATAWPDDAIVLPSRFASPASGAVGAPRERGEPGGPTGAGPGPGSTGEQVFVPKA